MNMEEYNGKRNEREVLLEFIQTYRDHPALWKVKSREYLNKISRNKGLVALQEVLKDIEPNCTREAVMKKINCLRTAFRREYKKFENSKKSGSCPEDIYIPSLWYFDEMMFVVDQDMTQESSSTLDFMSHLEEEMVEEPLEIEEDYTYSQVAAVKRRRKTSRSEEILDLVAKRLEESADKDESGNEAFGKYVALRLNSMDPCTAVLARKILNDVLFEAEVGNLSPSSRIVIAPP
ncbi:uncharacterized protein LOC143029829 [Oratosquilla oratoria]|uniref:uncharacterized protein LOC143029829 n=1 Tax=Oratosquilla oratoria TaxID=337810 RepID=UPI003F772FF3